MSKRFSFKSLKNPVIVDPHAQIVYPKKFLSINLCIILYPINNNCRIAGNVGIYDYIYYVNDALESAALRRMEVILERTDSHSLWILIIYFMICIDNIINLLDDKTCPPYSSCIIVVIITLDVWASVIGTVTLFFICLQSGNFCAHHSIMRTLYELR